MRTTPDQRWECLQRQEMMCCVLGDLIQEGCDNKLADDLYCDCDLHEAV